MANKTFKAGQSEQTLGEKKQPVERQDFIHIAILVTIALAIGVYLIATTVLIAKDGVFYIERAQNFLTDPINIIKEHPPGYPFLVLMAHKFTGLFSNNSSAQSWVYSAQSITLLCRLFALIPLYFTGRILVGSRKSFWAVLILMILPHSAKLGCEVVREWPYILFLSVGFLCLLAGANQPKWWVLGLAGLSTGMGYLIREESAQIVIYGLVWFALCMFLPRLCGLSQCKIIIALASLLIGFAIPTIPYMKFTGQIIPAKMKNLPNIPFSNTLPDKTDIQKVNAVRANYNVAEIVSPNVLKALGEVFRTTGENLMWFFMPALAIGLYCRFRSNAKRKERFLITAFVLINVTMIALRYCYVQPHVSARWNLPLITFTIFYIPVGLQVIGNWLESKFPMNKQKTDLSQDKEGTWFLVLLLIGISICIPKLFTPLRIEDQSYREAANWLKENTAPTAIVAVPDKRIAFYAERKGLEYDKQIPEQVDYVVRIVESEDEKLVFDKETKEEYSTPVNKDRKRGKLVICRVIH